VIAEVLDKVLANPAEGAVEVGLEVVIASENYGKFLLGSEENVTIYFEHIGENRVRILDIQY
jgi:hypothetical protein